MARTIKTTLELGGESAYKKGLQSIDRALKAMSGELSDATAKFAENSSSLKNVSDLSRAYKNSVEQQKVKVESLKGAVERSNAAYEEALQKYNEAAAGGNEHSKAALKAALALDAAEKSLDSYKSKLASAEKYLAKTTKKMEEFADKNKNISALAQTVDKLKNKISGLSIVKKASSGFEELKKKASGISEKLTPVTNQLKKVQTGGRAVKGAFELAARKAAAIKEKLQPAINICKNVAKAAAKITFKAAEAGAKSVTAAVKAAAKAFTAYAAAAAGAGTVVFASIENTREYRNDLAKLQQGAATASNSFDVMKGQLVNLTALTGESDSSIEALSNLMSAGFTDSQIISAVDALSGAVIKFPDTLKIESLSDSLQETIATGAGTGQFAELIERSGDSLDDFNAGLAACGSEAERQQYALAYLADSGLAEVNKEYEKSHKALLDYEKAEQAVTDANSKIAESAMPIAASFKKGYAGVLSAFADVLSGVDATGADLSAKISSFLNNIANMAVQYLPVLLTAVNSVIQAVITNLPAMINMILPVLVTGFNTLISGLVEALPEVLPTLLEGFVTLFTGLIDALNQVIEILVPMLPELITRITETLIENLPLLLEGALQLFLGLIQSLDQVIEQLMPMLPTLISNLCDTLIAHIDEIISAGFDLLIGLIDGITKCIPTLLEKVPEIINKLVNSLTEDGKLRQLIQAGIDLIVALAEGLPKAIPDIILAIPEVVSAIVDELMKTDWLQVGIDIIKGIGEGLVEGVGAIGGKIKEMAGNLLDGVRNAFSINSPSKVFRDKVGIFLAQGVGVGFEEEMKKVSEDMSRAIPTEFNTVINTDASAVSKSGQGGNGNTFECGAVSYIFENINIYNDKDYEELGYRLERERQKARLAMGNM